MEVKTLLRLIKDDVSHLEGITSEFSLESFPSSDEIEVALVRANALLKELDLLRKLNDHHESGLKTNIVVQEQKVIISEPDHVTPETFGLLTREQKKDEPAEEVPVVLAPVSHAGVHLEALTEPAGVVLETTAENKHDSATSGSIKETAIAASALQVEGVADNIDETPVSPDVMDQREEILAEEFSEVKKTLNETLGESHQMVNDILAPGKSEPGYKLVPIDSIWDGIGLNDRFLFVRELFANNSAAFESTVAALDELSSIHDAVNYLKSNFKWNKTATSQKFLVLVKRRFTKL